MIEKEIKVLVNGTWHEVDIGKLKSLENIQAVQIKETMSVEEVKQYYPELLFESK